MYQAANASSKSDDWINILDFVGYVVFFVSIFFVLHALYIIGLSLASSKKYEQFQSQSLADVLKEISDLPYFGRLQRVLYSWRFGSFSRLREKAEFKIITALFRDTYLIPYNFNFGLYLSGCFEKYSMRIINISYSNWMFLLILLMGNYLRVKFGNLETYNCEGFRTTSGDDVKVDDGTSNRCAILQLRFFCVCGVLIAFYVCGVHFMGRVYVIR